MVSLISSYQPQQPVCQVLIGLPQCIVPLGHRPLRRKLTATGVFPRHPLGCMPKARVASAMDTPTTIALQPWLDQPFDPPLLLGPHRL